MKSTKKLVAALAAVALTGTAGAGIVHAATADNIVAGGATFPLNLMESCRSTFPADSTNTQSATVQYSGVGSGTGRKNFYLNTYQFAMSDSRWSTSDSDWRSGDTASNKSFVFIPMIAGAIDVAYNVSGVKPAGTVIQLKAATVAKIFAGQITTWNDAAIKADNPVAARPSLSGLNNKARFLLGTVTKSKIGLTINVNKTLVTKSLKNLVITSQVGSAKAKTVYNAKVKAGISKVSVEYTSGAVYTVKWNGKTTIGTMTKDASTITLPATPITVVYRKESSGTTNNFQNFLKSTTPSVWTTVADAFSPPSGVPSDGSFISAQGNDGVANGVMNKDGAIGYAEVSFVNERQLAGKSITAAKIQNASGAFLQGSSTGAASFVSAGAIDETTGYVTFDYTTPKADAYPITAVSYGMANKASGPATTAQNVTAKRYVQYVLNTCAPAVAEIKGYAPLPANFVEVALRLSNQIGA